MSRVNLIIAFFVIMALGSCLGSEKIEFARAIYNSLNYSEDASFGLNTEYTSNNWLRMGPEKVIERLKSNSLRAAEYNMTHIVGLYYLQAEPDFGYSRAVNEEGYREKHVPSPADRTYWARVIRKPALTVANLSLHYPIRGLVFDFELYLVSEHRTVGEHNWRRDFYSYDANALSEFGKSRGVQVPELDDGERDEWLRSNGLLQDFQAWQVNTVREMAAETEESVHSINPNLSLGVLGFKDTWLDWTTLEGFSDGPPVTLWTESTYAGYDEGMIEYLRDQSILRGLDCEVLPGLWNQALEPWTFLEDMERAIRHSGAFWIYRANKEEWYRLGDRETYSKAFEAFNRYILFDRARANPLPSFDLYPGVIAWPYAGPNGVSVLMKPEWGLDPEEDISLVTDEEELEYVGPNLTIRDLSADSIGATEVPCIVYGLNESDLASMEAWSLIRELSDLLEAYHGLGLGEVEGLDSDLEAAISDFESGKYTEVKSRLKPLSEAGYSGVLDVVLPMVREAVGNPRESGIPVESIRDILDAARLYESGKMSEGNRDLVGGLRSWSLAVSEFPPRLSVSLLVLFVLVDVLVAGYSPYHFCCQDDGY